MMPMGAVHTYIDAFNRADERAMAEAFANSVSILDGLPPHKWQGPNAGEQWYKDLVLASEHQGTGNYSVILGYPWHVSTTGDHAYVVVPATMTFTVHGKKVMQTGAVITAVLHNHSGRWLISAWAWAKGQFVEVG
jgi:ketosteroid isomerase-like protein